MTRKPVQWLRTECNPMQAAQRMRADAMRAENPSSASDAWPASRNQDVMWPASRFALVHSRRKLAEPGCNTHNSSNDGTQSASTVALDDGHQWMP